MKTFQDIFFKLIDENKEEIEQKLERNPEFIKKILNFSIKNVSKQLYSDLNKDKSDILIKIRNTAEQFNKRLYKTWKKPIDNLEMLIEISMESAIKFVDVFYDKAKKENNSLFAALKNIHAR